MKSFTQFGKSRPLVTVLDIHGVIARAGRGGRAISISSMQAPIEAAFRPKNLAGVALVINSPGGSPVQSRLIHAAIRRAAAKRSTRVYAFVEDVGASGGYLLALAGDEIYADSSSIVGSIGVIAAGFGFQEAMARLGVERRIHTAGDAKSQLDPFRAESPEDVARLQAVLGAIHDDFVALVRERRGDRLCEKADIFTGAFWTARPALERGLIDGIDHLAEFARKKWGNDVRLKRIPSGKGALFRALSGGAGAERVVDVLGETAMWARFGL